MKKKRFQVDGVKYNYIEFEEVTKEWIRKKVDQSPISESGIVMLPLSFDIETTSFYSEKYKKDLIMFRIFKSS